VGRATIKGMINEDNFIGRGRQQGREKFAKLLKAEREKA